MTPFSTLLNRLVSLLLLAGLLLALAGPLPAQAGPASQVPRPLQPEIRYPQRHDTSKALRDVPVTQPPAASASHEASERLSFPKVELAAEAAPGEPDAALQTRPSAANIPATGFNFEGVSNVNGVLPPDTNGDVGPNHYVQWVNLSMAVWQIDRSTNTATLAYGPTNGNAIWNGFGGACETTNDGDPIVLYDHLADRWMISQFALPNFPSGPYYECIAVSTTGDPTGQWHRYSFLASSTKMNDYPHLGVWPDGYYMTVNQFTNGSSWGGAGVFVFERDKMLLGQTARMVYFDLYTVNSAYGGMLPSDLDGPPPPAGTPNYFVEVDDSSWIGPNDAMRLWEFHVDWTTPSNSTFGLSGNPNATLAVAGFNPLSTGIPQPGTSVRLDNLADRLMHRLQYRYLNGSGVLVTNHTVNAGSGQAAVRWYEVRRLGSSWSIHQQGTYAGPTTNSDHRWMGSAAMDSAGNIAIGYSLSSSASYPSIKYTGRLYVDPLGEMPQGEGQIIAGGGSQTHSAARWGDYSMLSVDPVDSCTFWFTTEYLQSSSSSGWRTRVGSFTFPSCLTGLVGSISGQVTNSSSGSPLVGATVEAGGFSTLTDGSGNYQLDSLPIGAYTVTASLYGYVPASLTGIPVAYAQTTSADLALAPRPVVNISGVVKDGSGQGWPLYARLQISAEGYAGTVFTDPETGFYSLNLAGGVPHTFDVSAVAGGYTPQSLNYTPTAVQATQNFNLLVAPSPCTAPGYDPANACAPLSGSLLVGAVYDFNTGQSLPGAAVASQVLPGEQTLSYATPDDPSVPDGFFTLFSSQTGPVSFAASLLYYGSEVLSVPITAGGIASQDFHLRAGRLAASPTGFDVTLAYTQAVTQALEVANIGSLPADFTLTEVAAATETQAPTGPFAIPTRHTSPKRVADLTAAAVFDYQPPAAPALPGGALLGSLETNLAGAWGVGYDSRLGSLWVGNVTASGGDDAAHAFSLKGQPLGSPVSLQAPQVVFSADMTYDPFSGRLWALNISGGNCLVAFDPQLGSLTGESICPSFDNSQRGLAFNPLNRTFYSGSWTDGILYHFDASGAILDSANLNLNIAGLAFNPATRRLYVLSNADRGFDVYVLDTQNGYTVLGGFDIPGLGSFEQGGLELDCSGSLWAVNQSTGRLLRAASGQVSACTWSDVSWLQVSPTAGALAAGANQPVELVFTPSLGQSGANYAHLVLSGNTPYAPVQVPVKMTVLPYYLFSAAPDAVARSGAAGQNLTYKITVANQGNATDMYQVAVSGNTWPTSAPALTSPALPGKTTSFNVTVSIPAGALPLDSDTALVTVTSYNDHNRQAQISLTSSAAATYALALSGSQSASGAPGGAVTYTLAMTNTGQVTDTFSLNLSGSLWTVEAPAAPGPLGPGESAVLSFIVHVPVNALGGASDELTVTLASSGDPSVTMVAVFTTTAYHRSFLPVLLR